MSKDVVSRCDIGRNSDGPAIVVCDQSIACPISWECGVVEKTDSIDLEEFKGGLVDG